MRPFTIRLIDRTAADARHYQIRLKTVPGSKGPGLARGHVSEVRQTVLALIESKHRGANMPDALTQQQAAIQEKRCDNRTRPEGWLPLSLRHRVDITMARVRSLSELTPITAVDSELALFDTQFLQNPGSSGVGLPAGHAGGLRGG